MNMRGQDHLDMTTIHAARALGISSHGIVLNNQADLVLFDTKNIRNVLLERPERIGVWKNGIQVDINRSSIHEGILKKKIKLDWK